MAKNQPKGKKAKQKQMIIISLPVTNLTKSVGFYLAIGFTRKFSDKGSACMVLSDTISVMLITHSMWKGFTTRLIPDPKKSAQMALILSRDSQKAVDAMVEKGKKAGGKADPNPKEDYGFMYGRSLEDPDGHIWEPKWMDRVPMIKQS